MERSEIEQHLVKRLKGTNWDWCFEPNEHLFDSPYRHDTWHIFHKHQKMFGGFVTDNSYFQTSRGGFFGTMSGNPKKAIDTLFDHLLEYERKYILKGDE